MKAKRKAIAPVVFCFLILLTLVDIGSPPSLAAQDIVVESANPPVAEQGTVNLDVVIKGSGFGRGGAAKFFVSGTDFTDPGGITVNSTTFKGPNRLIANITVADGATISKFDVQVQSNGRIGKGIELFAVIEKGTGAEDSGNHPALTIEFRDFQVGGTADQVQSDGLGLEHPNCQVAAHCYIDGKQKVEAKAGGEVQPNPPGIRLVTNRSGNPGAGRQLFLDLSECKEFDSENQCPLPAPFDTNRVFVDARIRVRPLGGDFDIFYTMPLNSPQDMGLTIVPLIPDHQLWVAFDPLTTEDPGLGFCSTPGQAVNVTAISRDAQDRNNAWEVEATDRRAVVCGREVSPPGVQRDFGDLLMTFKFTAKVVPKKGKK